METQELIKHAQNGTLKAQLIVPKDINVYEIMNISDMTLLRKLASYSEEFKFLSETETWEKNRDRQYILSSMDRLNKFLSDIENGGCRCIKYRFFSENPKLEQEIGLININSQTGDYFNESFECECTECNTSFNVSSQEQRFGVSYTWLRKT